MGASAMSGGEHNDLVEAFRLIDEIPLVKHEEGDFARLLDEADEQGSVCMCRKDGTVFMTLPRSLWDHLRSL